MFSKRIIFALVALALSSLFCTLPGLAMTVTPQGVADEASSDAPVIEEQPAETPIQSTGSISGSLGYPSEMIPPLRIIAFATGSEEYFFTQTEYNQTTYQIDNLPPGNYRVVAYVNDETGQFPSGFVAGYTAAVVCGFGEACTDHALIDVEVGAGAAVTNIDPKDWDYTGQLFPADPMVERGSISGTLIYPSEFIPAQRIVAVNVNFNQYFYVDTLEGQNTYTIEGLPAGTYHVVAYTLSEPYLAAGYSAFVTCGLSANCTDHTLLDVVVKDGQQTTGIDPHDWYAPEGTFPPDLSRP